MLTKLLEGKPYKNRPLQSISLNLCFDRETALILNELAPTKKSRSAYLARLLHAEVARKEERAKLKQLLVEENEECNGV